MYIDSDQNRAGEFCPPPYTIPSFTPTPLAEKVLFENCMLLFSIQSTIKNEVR